MNKVRAYAVLRGYGGLHIVRTYAKPVGDRIQIDYPGSPLVDPKDVFASRLEALNRMLELHDAESKKKRASILSSIKREEKKK